MTATEHLAAAENLLASMDEEPATDDILYALSLALEALGHALCGIALELGVPAPQEPSVSGSDAQG